MKTASFSLLLLAAAALVAGCDSESKTPAQKARPVLSALAERQTGASAAFAGTVESRYSARLAFRVLGRVIERNVNTGDSVKKGARLAALDPVPFDLAVRDARAGLANAEAQLVNALATERRRRTLFEEKHIPEQQLEAVQQARAAAQAAVTQARAALDKALEQRGYTVLSPEFDGVVTAVNVEIGQVITAGQPVITVARPDVREAVIDVPDDAAASLKVGSPFEVALQINPLKRISGQLREIAPKVDALTRSQRVKITLDDPPADFRLGTSITAYATDETTARIRIPAAALFDQDGKQHVWIVNPAAKTVSLREVKISSQDGQNAVVAAGLEPGDRVVTAGLHSLAPGQSVKIPEETQQ